MKFRHLYNWDVFILKAKEKFGRWLVTLQELSHAEEEDAIAVYEGRARPKVPSARYIEISNDIQLAKNRLMVFLNDYDESNYGTYHEEASAFLGRVGALLGYEAPLTDAELTEIIEEEEAENKKHLDPAEEIEIDQNETDMEDADWMLIYGEGDGNDSIEDGELR